MTRTLLACALIAAALPFAPAAQTGSGQHATQPYRIGDRLAPGRAAPPAKKAEPRYREIRWDDLISPGWNPEKISKSLNLDVLPDNDARAIAAMEQLRLEWAKAPANEKLDGAEVRLAGFVVPLEYQGNALREFLLVPYFGACIHVPPPPANQIVHVIAKKPVANTATMDAVWVGGRLTLSFVSTRMGASGYRLEATQVEAYKQKP